MIDSLLVANRGEIACRIFRTARRLGVRTVAVYSEADAGAAHVSMADRAVAIGPAPAGESYLSPERVLAAAREGGARAVHPGYGFLSENADFAQAVIDAGLVWVGPSPAAIRAMGRKDAAKALMAKAGVPVTPGYLGEEQSIERLSAEAARIGFPVLIKAVAGGGGKGMRRVDRAEDFAAALASARREAASAFGDERVLLETYVARPRHIEVQVFGDAHGGFVHLFERDCSLQRRHQKVVEESPAPGLDEAARTAVCEAAVQAARAVGYVGAGTVEFIADASNGLSADRIWFMEMNTRLQVEHPVTEAVTGLDLVEWQLRIAAGERLPMTQEEIRMRGHAVEARLYAESPEQGFLPSVGRLEHLRLPLGEVRVDAGVAEGGEVTTWYDPMIAKLIAHAPTREEALAVLAQAASGVEAWPVKTNAGFLTRLLEHPDFIAGQADTGFIEEQLETLAPTPPPSNAALSAAAQALANDQVRAGEEESPWSALTGFRLNAAPEPAARIFYGGAAFSAPLDGGPPLRSVLVTPHGEAVVFECGEALTFSLASPAWESDGAASGDGRVTAPLPGRVAVIAVEAGQAVRRGEVLAVLEAMKMEHALKAPFDGVVETTLAGVGDQVEEGSTLLEIRAQD